VRARAGGGGGAAGMAEGWVNARPPTHAVAVRVAGLEVRPARAASAQSRRAATASRVGCRPRTQALLSYARKSPSRTGNVGGPRRVDRAELRAGAATAAR